ncbi:MAG: AAA family ATPase [Bacteroidia bacterium]|nr:AAA family ATPase [Bacteroidia bacterium]MCF8427027.1 AAA family ATPase [Bacteroidia bacterium]MCF8446479.1 AAA family ATPase [Bacteroidia bacterium]
MKNIFYSKGYKDSLPLLSVFPCYVFIKDGWNDFGFYTLFNLFYYNSRNDYEEIGSIKILDINDSYTNIPIEFYRLEKNFFSLGQSLEFYENIKKIAPESFTKVLDCINDISINDDLFEEVKIESGFVASLIRFGSAEKALNEAKLLLFENVRKVNENLFFNYKVKIEGAEAHHEVYFDFKNTELLPYRLNIIIGKNGTGKTQFLGSMVNSISGVDKRNKFQPYNPLFNKVIAISYSLFDDFPKPPETTVFSYKYLGLRTEDDGIINDDRLSSKLKVSLIKIIENDRIHIWYNRIGQIINLENLGIENPYQLTKDWVETISYQKAKRLSSGQSIILFILTELIANIENETFILFDEPETHLHPSAISGLTNCFYGILEDFDSFAIISTHSPIIIQDIPSKYITIFDRLGNIPIIRKLPIESFGENISTITSTVFETIDVKELYKVYLDKLNFTRFDQNELFENGLSINAMLYLEAIKNKFI